MCIQRTVLSSSLLVGNLCANLIKAAMNSCDDFIIFRFGFYLVNSRDRVFQRMRGLPRVERASSAGNGYVGIYTCAGDLAINGNSVAMDMRTHGNGLHSRGPSQGDISDTQFDDSASFHSASAQQLSGSSMQSSLNRASHSPSKDSEPLLRPFKFVVFNPLNICLLQLVHPRILLQHDGLPVFESACTCVKEY